MQDLQQIEEQQLFSPQKKKEIYDVDAQNQRLKLLMGEFNFYTKNLGYKLKNIESLIYIFKEQQIIEKQYTKSLLKLWNSSHLQVDPQNINQTDTQDLLVQVKDEIVDKIKISQHQQEIDQLQMNDLQNWQKLTQEKLKQIESDCKFIDKDTFTQHSKIPKLKDKYVKYSRDFELSFIQQDCVNINIESTQLQKDKIMNKNIQIHQDMVYSKRSLQDQIQKHKKNAQNQAQIIEKFNGQLHDFHNSLKVNMGNLILKNFQEVEVQYQNKLELTQQRQEQIKNSQSQTDSLNQLKQIQLYSNLTNYLQDKEHYQIEIFSPFRTFLTRFAARLCDKYINKSLKNQLQNSPNDKIQVESSLRNHSDFKDQLFQYLKLQIDYYTVKKGDSQEDLNIGVLLMKYKNQKSFVLETIENYDKLYEVQDSFNSSKDIKQNEQQQSNNNDNLQQQEKQEQQQPEILIENNNKENIQEQQINVDDYQNNEQQINTNSNQNNSPQNNNNNNQENNEQENQNNEQQQQQLNDNNEQNQQIPENQDQNSVQDQENQQLLKQDQDQQNNIEEEQKEEQNQQEQDQIQQNQKEYEEIQQQYKEFITNYFEIKENVTGTTNEVKTIDLMISIIFYYCHPKIEECITNEDLKFLKIAQTNKLYRDILCSCIQSFRNFGKKEFKAKPFHNLQRIFKNIINSCNKYKDAKNGKIMMVMCFTLFQNIEVPKQNGSKTQIIIGQRYIYEFLVSNGIWQNIDLWEAIIYSCIIEDIDAQLTNKGLSTNDWLQQFKNLVQSNLLSVGINMLKFNKSKEGVKQILGKLGQQYGLLDVQISDIYKVINNTQQGTVNVSDYKSPFNEEKEKKNEFDFVVRQKDQSQFRSNIYEYDNQSIFEKLFPFQKK